MLRYPWTTFEILTIDDFIAVKELITAVNPRIAAFDTETDGLHIIKSTPFLFIFGFFNKTEKKHHIILVDKDQTHGMYAYYIKELLNLTKDCDVVLGHNVKYDLHMLRNIGINYQSTNISDTMFYIRYGHPALTPKNGGPPLALKDYTAQYLTRDAKYHEQLLKKEQTTIATNYNNRLFYLLKTKNPTYTPKYIKDFFKKDRLNSPEDLPKDAYEIYTTWRKIELPKDVEKNITTLVESSNIPYTRINRTLLKKYATLDVVYTLEIYHQLQPIVEYQQNTHAIAIENKLLWPLLEMERVGLDVDTAYLKASKTRLKSYILSQREHLEQITQEQFQIGQHTIIKKILEKLLNTELESTNKTKLNRLLAELKANSPEHVCIDIIKTINRLRTMEKWYSTYILRFENQLKHSKKIYTQINQVGTVSGRVTSDFQQFPKEGIYDHEDTLLFQPRRMVIVPKDDNFDALVLIDYSQIELRLQALYTILLNAPDLNLTRAYMPYRCTNKEGIKFNYNNPKHLKNIFEQDWFLDESGELWKPTDIHGKTAEKAFDTTPDDPNFSKYRSKAKTINFAKNYGATIKAISEQFPDYSLEMIQKIDAAYYETYPGIRAYQDYCYKIAENPYVTNLYNVRYYGLSGHKIINILIQGSAAFLLKTKIIEIYEYSKAHQIKSQFQMNIHDELIWKKHKSESAVFTTFQTIMEDLNTLVPLVAEISIAYENWADKKEIKEVPT